MMRSTKGWSEPGAGCAIIVNMKWLLTTPANADLDSLQQELEAVGATLESQEPVPLDDDQQVLYADGPDDLSDRLSETNRSIHVHPSSELELY
jgi:hypothetical protein